MLSCKRKKILSELFQSVRRFRNIPLSVIAIYRRVRNRIILMFISSNKFFYMWKYKISCLYANIFNRRSTMFSKQRFLKKCNFLYPHFLQILPDSRLCVYLHCFMKINYRMKLYQTQLVYTNNTFLYDVLIINRN